MIDFFNSNFFIALVTFVVGSFAIFLYSKRKKDFKAGAASLILQEIRYAETQIRTYRESGGGYPLSIKLLPTNSWHSNIHLFVRELDETDLDLISRFYSKVAYIDIVIDQISKFKIQSLVPAQTQLGQTQPQPAPETEDETTKRLQQGEQTYGLAAQGILNQVSHEIEFIYNTPVVEKLRKIAKKKKNFLF